MDKIILTHSLRTTDDSNVLVVGSCRSGKTNFFVKPNLFNLKDSVIVIGRDDDKFFEETANYRKEKFKQKIFTNKDENFISEIKTLDSLPNDTYTIYFTAPVINRQKRMRLLFYPFELIMDYVYNNSSPKNPVTIIIDDLSLFPICQDNFTHFVDNVRIVATVQSIWDLFKIYGKTHTEDILNSFKSKMFFHINSQSDAEYIVNNYNPQISREKILQLKYQCLIVGLKKEPILVNDKIIHWFAYGNPHRRGI